jgi:hypothetical protein
MAQIKRDELPALRGIGIEHPTIRQVYYRLVSKGTIPNTKSSYTYLDRILTAARMKGAVHPDDGDPNNGRLDPSTFADETRPEADLSELRPPEDFADYYIELLKELEGYYDPSIWHGQEYYVEVWIEKMALESTFEGILRDRYVTVVVNRGYNSLTALQESVNRLLKIQYSQNKKIVILYFGDHDPSGLDMDRDLNDRLRQLGLRDFEFRRVGLTSQQIEDFGLPANPDDKTLKKLVNDSRTTDFVNRFGSLHGNVVELDALAIRENEFRQLVLDAVDAYYNPQVWEQLKSRFDSKRVKNRIKKRVKFLD